MNYRSIFCFAILFVLVATGCGMNNTADNRSTQDKIHSLKSGTSDTGSKEAAADGGYRYDELKPMWANAERIDSIPSTEWSAVIGKELKDTAGSGEATFYYYNRELEKIKVRRGKTTSWQLKEYYLLKGQLSLVVERSLDTDDPAEPDTIVTQSFFANGEILHQLNSQDCGAPWANEYLQGEQKRIGGEFDKLRRLVENFD